MVTESSDSLLLFSRNINMGALTHVETLKDNVGGVDGLEGARSVAVSPDGRRVYVAAMYDRSVAVYMWDPATEALTFVEVIRNAEK